MLIFLLAKWFSSEARVMSHYINTTSFSTKDVYILRRPDLIQNDDGVRARITSYVYVYKQCARIVHVYVFYLHTIVL